MKYLLWIGLFLLVYWALRKTRNRVTRTPPPPASRKPEKMVACAHCGVNLPASEGIRSGEYYYCCIEHMHAAEPRKN